MSERVVIDIDAGVADVRMDRGDKMNAMDGKMFAALVEAADELAANNSVRAVVLSGNGPSFCAGLDFSGFQAMAGGAGPGDMAGGAGKGDMAGGAGKGDMAGGAGKGDMAGATGPDEIGGLESARAHVTHRAQQAVWGWHELPMPVIAAVHGVAFGAGCQLAVGADIRFVAPDVRMSVLEIRWGLSPDMTITSLLSGLVGADRAKELIWTGREVSGPEAVEIGLATHIADDPHGAAMELAGLIATKSPHAIRAGKRLVNGAAAEDYNAQFAAERREIGALIGSPNQVESVQAYFEKRAPVYADVHEPPTG